MLGNILRVCDSYAPTVVCVCERERERERGRERERERVVVVDHWYEMQETRERCCFETTPFSEEGLEKKKGKVRE